MAKPKPDPAAVRHLKDDEGKSFRQIAKLLDSNYAAVNRAYQVAIANGTSPSQSTNKPHETPQPVITTTDANCNRTPSQIFSP